VRARVGIGDDAGGEAEAHAEMEVAEASRAESVADAVHRLASRLEVGLGEEEEEFLATVAGNEVGSAEFPLEHAAEVGEHAVTAIATEALVDMSHPVDVEQHQGKGHVVPTRPLEFLPDPTVERVECPATGQGIDM